MTQTKVSIPAIPIEPKKNLLDGNIVDHTRPPSADSIPRGRNVSGRSWKLRPQKRASSLIKTSVNNQSKTWETRQVERRMRQEANELQQQIQGETKQKRLLKKERRLENEKRKAENELKNMERFTQKLNLEKVDRTLKAMSKKQLRQIKKTRLNPKTGVVEYVSAYAK